MKFLKITFVYAALFTATLLAFSNDAHALTKKKGATGLFGGGAFAIGLGYSIDTADQNGLNSLIDASKTAVNSSVSKLSSANEFLGFVTFKFANGYTALQLRPTYFTQSESGSGSDGSHSYSLTGYTLFPLARLIALSNDLIDFYIQGGLGYGSLSGDIQNGSRKASFSGSAFGMQVGMGAEFCFVPTHCFAVEGNYRYLPIDRNIVSSASGGLPYGTTQASKDKELEDASANDVATTLSGVSGSISYVFNF
ncbi:MAG: hypothetical protein ACXVAX_02665 [Pseudobdellovibrio sp.]